MASFHTIVAALIAFAVALLPAIGAAIISPSPAEVTTAVDGADMPCCLCCKTQDESKATACVLQCVALSGAVLPAMGVATPRDAKKPRRSFVNGIADGLARAPPTRPPPA